MKYILLAILFLMQLQLQSCISCNRTKDVICFDGGLILNGVGFATADFDSAVAVRYKQDNIFDSVVDTFVIRYEAWPVHQDTGSIFLRDTLISKLTGRIADNILPGFDYKIYLPSAGQTYQITQIQQSGNTHHVFEYKEQSFSPGPPPCYNSITYVNINGNSYSFPISLTDQYSHLYLKK